MLTLQLFFAGALSSFAREYSPLAACAPNSATLCFQLGRFSATLAARDQRTGNTGAGQAIPQNDLFGYFSIPALTADASNPEVFVKVLDGRPVNGKFWVFYGGLTDLEYTLTVRDTTTGAVKNYTKSAGTSCGGFDTGAFSKQGPSVAMDAETNNDMHSLFQTNDETGIIPQTACAAGIDRLCLHSSRFHVSLMAKDQRTSRSGAGQAIPQNNVFGYFSIPALTSNPSNPEVFVKMLDGTAVNGKYWVFYGSLTDLELTITVTDTTTGAIKTYNRVAGSACGGFDTGAFDPTVANYSLAVSKSGSGQGTVTGTGISCGSDCSESFASGMSTTLTANASAGSSFGAWSGCDSVSGITCSVTMNSNRVVTATFNASSSPTITFAGGTLSDLRALSATLNFGNLNLTGWLDLAPGDGSSVTIRSESLTIPTGGGVRFNQNDCSYQPPPNLTLIANATINIDGGEISLSGKFGRRTSDSTTCNSCSGVRGANVTLQAPSITLGETKTTRITVSGGSGSSSYVGYGIDVGCNGGTGGTVTLTGNGSMTLGRYFTLDFDGGNGGTGSGTGGSNGTAGAAGRVTFSGALPNVYESIGENALLHNAQLLTYQRFDIIGDVNQADDVASRGRNGSVSINFSNGVTDFCEDLFVLQLRAAANLHLGLSSSGAGDLDLHLLNSSLSRVLASSNGSTSSETIDYSAAVGSYVVCVSWADDNRNAITPAQRYKLSVGQ